MNPQHPSVELFRDYLLGKLSLGESNRIDLHIEQCEECQSVLAKIDGQDSLTDLLVDSYSPNHEPSEPSTPAGNPMEALTIDTSATIPHSQRNPTDENDDSFEIEGYHIESEIGRGGMGVVYRAFHHKLKRPVALKVLLSGAHADSVEQKRFLLEAEMIAKLQHPGIVQIYEVGQQGNHLYIALELIEGGNLSDWLATNDRVSPIWAATMLLQLAKSVQFAHEQGVIHRDLKPGNILLAAQHDGTAESERGWSPSIHGSGSGEVLQYVPKAKITDFGLAKNTSTNTELTRTGMTVGTPAYMSPEQAIGRDSNTRPTTDIYSLGAIFYELLTGKPPFVGTDVFSVIRAVIEDDPLSPRQFEKSIPRDLETICLKCLNKPPGQRYRTVAELANDLELFLSGEPIESRSLTPVSRTLRWSRRKPLLAGTAFAAIVFYCHHLALRSLGVELHLNPDFQRTVTLLMPGWVVLAGVAQWLVGKNRNRLIGYLLYGVLSIGGTTAIFTLDQGPNSAPVPIYFIIVVACAIISPKPLATWSVTFVAMAGYACLVAHAYFYDPANMVSLEEFSVFMSLLVILGAQLHLMLRRNLSVG